MNDLDKLICPYCGTEQSTHKPDVATAYVCVTCCEKCNKKIWYGVKVTREYWTMWEENNGEN